MNSQRRYRMRNIHKALIAVFCSGIFITGIGTGIALSEFSSFAYSGKTTIGDVKMVTENLDYSFQLQEDQKLRIYGNYFFTAIRVIPLRLYRMRRFRRIPFVFRSPIMSRRSIPT